MPASTWAQLLGNRPTGCKSTGIRRWVSRVECTCEHQSKFDGRCTVCLRDGPRLLSLALCQSSTIVQPTQKPPHRIPASTIQAVKRNRKRSGGCGPPPGPDVFLVFTSHRTRALCHKFSACCPQSSYGRIVQKGYNIENILLDHHKNYRLSWWAPPGPTK